MLKGYLVAAAIAASSVPAMASHLALSDNNGDPLAITVAPGGTFEIDVMLVSDETLTGVTYSLNGSTSGLFAVTSRTLAAGTPFTDVTLSTFPFGLDPTTLDLGSGKTNVNVNEPAGTYSLAKLALSVDAAAPQGTYTIRAINGETAAAPLFNPVSVNDSAAYIVTVAVPEPASLAVIGLAGLVLGRRRVA